METFHEDVAGTVLFCFLACLGSLVLAVQAKGWHGLCPYGGRLRGNQSRALAAALFILAYSLYFADPQHRNVRNIEGFMSLVSLVVGALLALVFLALSASLFEELRRWLLRRRLTRGIKGKPLPPLRREVVEGAGEIVFTESWTGRGEDLLVVMEPVPTARYLAQVIASSLSPERELAILLPFSHSKTSLASSVGTGGLTRKVELLLACLADRAGGNPSGVRLLLVGNASHLFLRSPEASNRLLDQWRPERIVLLAPPLRHSTKGALTDSLVSNTPLDLLRAIPGERWLQSSRFHRLIRLWLISFLLVLPLALILPWAFKARWWFLSGPAGAAVASFWLAFHIKDPFPDGDPGTRREREQKPGFAFLELAGKDPSCRCIMIIAADELGGFKKAGMETPDSHASLEVVAEPMLLRGKMYSWPSFPTRLKEWIWG